MHFLLTYIDLRTVKYFAPAEPRLVNSNFSLARLMQRVLLPAGYLFLVRLLCVLKLTYTPSRMTDEFSIFSLNFLENFA